MARVGLSTSERIPSVRVQPRAEYLHSLGPAGLVNAVAGVLRPEFGDLAFSVSRVDLFADWQGWLLTREDSRRFLCRADARRTYEVGNVLTGFEFGSRKTQTLTARLYDKTADMALKGATWWSEVWGDAYREGSPVLRLEFEIGRQALSEFTLSSPAEVLESMGDLWRYATADWLTFRNPSADHTPSRWPVASEWRQVQRATLRHRSVGITRIRELQRASSVARLLPGLTGYLASYAALVGTADIDDTVGVVGHDLRHYEVTTRTRFADRVERRRREAEHR